MAKYPRWYLGAPFSSASKCVGVVDAILGAIGAFMVVADSSRSQGQHSYYSRNISLNLTCEVAAILVTAFLTQLLMGIALYYGAAAKSRPTIRLWLGVTVITSIFTGLFIRFFGLWIIRTFYLELEKEQDLEPITGGPMSSPPPQCREVVLQPPPPHYWEVAEIPPPNYWEVAQPTPPPHYSEVVAPQPPPAYMPVDINPTRHSSTCPTCTKKAISRIPFSPKEGSGVDGSTPMETGINSGGGGGIGVIGQCQSCHQPTVLSISAPERNQRGAEVHGDVGGQPSGRPNNIEMHF